MVTTGRVEATARPDGVPEGLATLSHRAAEFLPKGETAPQTRRYRE